MGVQINGDTGNISATKADYSGNVTIGGTLTYEDVTNIDSVGLVTAREGIEVGARPGVAASISVDGNMIVSGITTIGGDIKVGSGVTIGKDGHLFATGVTTSSTVKVGAAGKYPPMNKPLVPLLPIVPFDAPPSSKSPKFKAFANVCILTKSINAVIVGV